MFFTDINSPFYDLSTSTPILSIAIVFHILHDSLGTGNIPDSMITRQVALVNDAFRAKPGTFASSSDIKIEFVLAGVNRVNNTFWLENQKAAYSAVDSIIGASILWDHTRYLNVSTHKTANANGTLYPWDADAYPYWDFVRYDYRNVGHPENGKILAHEIAHYLSLHHYDMELCNASCLSDGSATGDLIFDTDYVPCGLSVLNCSGDALDTLCGHHSTTRENLMSTGGSPACWFEFTPTQAGRIRCGLGTYHPMVCLGIDEDSIEDSVTQYCVGDSSRIRLVVSWDTNLPTNGPDSLIVYGPGSSCTGATTRIAVVTPGTATTHHSVEWTGTCLPGAPSDWRYTIKTSEGPGGDVRVTRSECRSVGALSCPACVGVILENTIQHTVSQYCDGPASKIRFVVSWDTSIETSGADSLMIYPPTGVCPGATWRKSGVTPPNPTTHHSVEWIGTCYAGAVGEWRYSIQTSETSAPDAPISRSQCRPVDAVSCPSCGGGCRPPCEYE